MKRLLTFIAAASLLFCFNTTLVAQNTIKGKVFTPESHNGHDHAPGGHQGEVEYIPLPGASVVWKGTRLGTMTDLHGFFKLPAMEYGDTLQISMIGFTTVGLVYSGQKYVEIPLDEGVIIDAAVIETRQATTSISLLDPLNVQQLNRKELAKAACCNLSEAFETNASVDASFTDAVTGTRQIRMLGLDGKYTQILVDNLPGPRGLNVVQGLAFIPGPWIDAIAISKGTGSVINGYESITGQINVAMRNPKNAEPLHINVYGSGDGRIEWNHVSRHQVDRRWSTAILTHAELGITLNDRNDDSFLDTPLKRDIVLRNEWAYRGDRGIRGEYSVSAVKLNHMAGMKGAFENNSAAPFDLLSDLLVNQDSTAPWTAATRINRFEASAKTGFVFPGADWKSIGTQFFASTHEQEHQFGNRNYLGKENFFRGNLLFSSIIGSTDHKFTTGLSFLYDDFEEVGTWGADSGDWSAEADTMARTEMVPGAFIEYTWTAGPRLVVVAGLRGDYHNMFGAYASPRLHMRYSLAEETSIKLVAGRGFRTANVFMGQLGTWASNRSWNILGDLQPEVATNVGLNLVSKFRLNSRDASISLDGYFTDFENRVIIDFYNSPNSAQIYNSADPDSDYNRKSQSTTVQVEFDYSAHRRLDIRAAYRWVNAKTDYDDDEYDYMARDPFVAEHRAFTQWSYASKPGKEGQQTRVDATVQWVGSQRLPTPSTSQVSSDLEYADHPEFSPDFTQLNLQVTQTFKGNFELYAGVENLLDVKQDNPIVGARTGSGITDNFESSFDASLVYGPIFGRMTYAGLRWTLGG
jgi:outer membrane receptor for ferrienterochelin and colicins